MSPALVSLLCLCILNAVLLFYVIYIRQENFGTSWGKAGLISTLFLLIPILVFALWHQNRAEGRLKDLGLAVYPGFASSSGIASGFGDSPTWVFELDTGSSDVIAFYREKENHGEWRIIASNDDSLLFERPGEVLSILSDGKAVAFSVERKD